MRKTVGHDVFFECIDSEDPSCAHWKSTDWGEPGELELQLPIDQSALSSLQFTIFTSEVTF